MTQSLDIHKHDEERESLNWARITGISMALAVHVGALLLLLAPLAQPPAESVKEEVTMVNIVKPPPPPPPPPIQILADHSLCDTAHADHDETPRRHRP